MTRVPFSSRPLDRLWFIWFVVHIPLTALIDGQAVYPKHLVPTAVRALYLQALQFSKDALMLGMEAGDPALFWFKGFLMLEVWFQLPLFFVGAYCMYYNVKRVYPLLLIYSASVCTTLIPCLQHIISPPPSSASPKLAQLPKKDDFQLYFGLSTYIPFLLIPMVMMIDMAMRLTRVVGEVEKREIGKKRS